MRRQSGFTIVELLIALSVAAIASILMLTAYVYTYGNSLVQQTKTNMTLDSQLFLRRMVEDIRVSNEVRQANVLDDPSVSGTGGEWVTDDPANILVMTQPAVDADEDFIYDPDTGFPYQNEIVYFGQGRVMYRRVIANTEAIGNRAVTTCPSGTSGCPPDIKLVDNLENLLFEFYDIDDYDTALAEDARSIEIVVNLKRQLSGHEIKTTNKARVTLRNEN